MFPREKNGIPIMTENRRERKALSPLPWLFPLQYSCVRIKRGGSMEHIILLLYLEDVQYGRRLLRFLMGKKNPRLHPELITVKEKIKMRKGSKDEAVAILTDCIEIEEDEKHKVIYLCSEQDAKQKKIFQYQKAEEIYRILLTYLDISPRGQTSGNTKESGIEKGIFCVFSPEGTERTAFAVTLSQYLGQQGNCLYLNLSGFPVFFEEELKEEPSFERKGLAELLFLVHQDNFETLCRELQEPFGSACMLSPVTNFKDLLDCSMEDWGALFDNLLSKCGYDSIVIEMGQLFEYTLDLLGRADRIFIIREEGLCESIRAAVFRQYCRVEKKEALERRVEYIVLPFDKKEWEREISCQTLKELSQDTQKMNEIRRVLEEGETGEEVCIIEDDG